MENNRNNNNFQEEDYREPTYDKVGLVIGVLVGIVISVLGITDILMGIIICMFLGLVIGSFIKKN